MSSMDASGAPLKGSPTDILSPLRQTSRLMATKGKVSPVKVAPKSVGEEGPGADAVVAIAPSAGLVGDLGRIRLQDVHFSYVIDRRVSVLQGVTTEFQLGGMYLLKATGAPSDLTLTPTLTLTLTLTLILTPNPNPNQGPRARPPTWASMWSRPPSRRSSSSAPARHT